MCLITFAYKTHPDYALILLANRDEFYSRPARPAQFWEDEGYPDILAGKDLTAGGTWMGTHRNGKWAALTNYRDLDHIKEEAPSRGDLVLNFLKSNLSVRDFANQIRHNAQDYNGFNILIGDHEDIMHYDNETDLVTLVSHGIHSLSNALLNSPWTKSKRTKVNLHLHLKDDDLDKDALFDILLDETKALDKDLPYTGLSKEMEKAISSTFIITPDYGTRCSTLLIIHTDGTIEFTERTYKNGTKEIKEENTYTW